MKQLPLKLTLVEINHLQSLMKDNDDRGDYYGSPVQYWRRHDRILMKLKEATTFDKQT